MTTVSTQITTELTPATHNSWSLLALALIPFVIYAESYRFGLLEIDDHLYYLHFAALHGGSWRGLIDLWGATAMSDYAPISMLTLWLDLAVGGGSSWWFARLHELGWMSLGALAVHALVLRLGHSRRLAMAVSLVYVLHPACAQSALWLAERKNLVSLALSLWCLERYIATVRDGGGWRTAAAAWALGCAALLAKPHAVALPVILASYELMLGTGAWRMRVVRLLPPIAIAVLFVVCSLVFIRTDLHRLPLGGNLAAAIALDGGILLRYLGHTVLPTDLTIYYAVAEDQTVLASLGCWAVFGLIVALTLLPARPRRMIAFAWLWSLAALAPALNLAPQLAAMTDHYQQWALPGLILIGCLLIDEGLTHLPEPGRRRLAVLALLGVVVYAASLSLARVPEFSSKQRLAAAAVRKQPESAINWSLHSYCLTVGTPVTQREAAGQAAVRAFACADSDRIFADERLYAIIEAAVLLHQHRQFIDETTLVDAQSALLTGGATGDHAALARAQIDLRTGRPTQAIELLAAHFTSVLAQAAIEIRHQCRDGSHLPDDAPPMVGGGMAISSDQIVSFQQELFNQSLQWTLAVAYLDNQEPEKAFDVASVMVNRFPTDRAGRAVLAATYRRFGLADAAARVLSRAAP